METRKAEWSELLKLPNPTDFHDGETWYLLSQSWLSTFQESPTPGLIDNSDLLDEKGELKKGLEMGKDFSIVSQETWNDLVEEYSVLPQQEPIPRNVVGSNLYIYPSDLSRLKELVSSLNNKKMQAGESWYLIDYRWYTALKTYLDDGLEDNHPGAIDNAKLLGVNEYLSSCIYERVDFDYVDKPTWDEMVRIFTMNSEKDCIERKVMLDGHKFDTPESLIEKIRERLSMDSSMDIKIKVENPSKFSKLDSSRITYVTKDSNSIDAITFGSILSVEKHSPAKPLKLRNKNNSMDILTQFPPAIIWHLIQKDVRRKIRSLASVVYRISGILVFMNSIIQGLSNTPPITEYFANDNYIEDINKTNPLGMKGEIAKAFGEMIKLMWSGNYSYIVPRSFKSAVGRFAPQFSGYQQQDSQELLTFLLDGLHEDLNRVKQKPYIEIKDSGDRADEEVALEAWDVYKKRNDSVILDVFHGLLKSTLICPVCSKVSVTFDPFCYLSLPLPVHRDIQIKILLVWYDLSKAPTTFKLTVSKTGTIADLLKVLSRETKIPEDHFKVADIFNNKLHKELLSHNLISEIDRENALIYEVPPTTNENTLCYLYLREEKEKSLSTIFHRPIFLRVKKGISAEEFYDLTLSHLSHFIKKPDPDDTALKNNDEIKANGVSESALETQDDNENEDSSLASEDFKMNVGDDEDSQRSEKSLMFRLCILNLHGHLLVIGLEWTTENKMAYFDQELAQVVHQDKSTQKAPTKQSIKLTDCLELYTTTEKLGEDDAWYCPRCSEHQQATKKFDLWSLPSILVISLKRFSYTRNWRDKLDTLVDFPINGLDMSPYIINPNYGPAVYDLIAVSNHYGGMGGGHYTAMAKNKNDGEWYNFDDSNVQLKKEKDVVTPAAYVLFYRRRETQSKVSSSTGGSTSTCTSYNNSHIPNELNNGIDIKKW
ncbi:USP15 [Lepeophtheirus salmonis]|uniref:ubiquitinyl hydrolase 1 n=1 Tax=Lepeophtheirus salmonis TaxID=72036 RepID=A0A7R8CIX7_LEPSM|nr:USP15 [Lepeophtheirus salmonis]CAF2837379.1 USP15 [Lepeophtheirus salmonis]